jgi:arsenate reductase (thioredoxin)
MGKQKVLFLCTQNSARSQMAEGFLRHLAGDHFDVYSAGIDPTAELHPCAIEAMREVRVDISEQYPKGLRTYMGKQGFNYLIIVCARAEERCPKTFPGVGTTVPWIFEDPRRDDPLRVHAGAVPCGARRDRAEDKGPAGAPGGRTEEAPRGARATGTSGGFPKRDRRFQQRRREVGPLRPRLKQRPNFLENAVQDEVHRTALPRARVYKP